MDPYKFLAAVIVCLGIQVSYAEEYHPVKETVRPMKLLEQGIETHRIELVVADQELLALDAEPCAGCGLKRFLPTRHAKVSLNGRLVSPEELATLPAMPGIVFIGISSGLVERVSLRSAVMEDGQ